jgi:hypothetical protein
LSARQDPGHANIQGTLTLGGSIANTEWTHEKEPPGEKKPLTFFVPRCQIL